MWQYIESTIRLFSHRFGVLSFGRVLTALLISGMCGCSQQIKPIFEERHPALIWPPAPEPARIRYVGQLSTSADLKPPPAPFQVLGDLIIGAKKPDPLYGPRGVICTHDGARVWVADPGGRCIHMLDLEDRSYKKIGRVGGSHLLSPVGLCAGPDESIYVCDSESVDIHRLSSNTGELIESLKLPEDVRRPAALSYDSTAGELFVVDVSAHDIKVLGLDGRLRRIIGGRGNGPGQFNFPSGIADDGNMIWIVDTGNYRVQGMTRAGKPVITIGQAGDAPGDFAMPKGVAFDSDGHIYVVDGRFENVQVFDRSGRLLLVFGEEGTGPGKFWLPGGVFIDAKDRIWICDAYNRRVQVFQYVKEPQVSGAGETSGQARELPGVSVTQPSEADVRIPPATQSTEVEP